MKGLHFVAIALGVVAIAGGCRGGTSSSIIPLAGTAGRSESGTCKSSGSGNTITVCVRIPKAGISVTVTDTIYGDDAAQIGSEPCPEGGSGYLCVVGFQAPSETLNQIKIEASGRSGNASGTFPLEAGAQPVTAVLGGTIASIAVLPFHSTSTTLEPSSLPVGQTEHVWIIAKDKKGEAIIGQYRPTVYISTTGKLRHTGKALRSSDQAEDLVVFWETLEDNGRSYSGSIRAYASPGPRSTPARVGSTSGVAYFPVTGTDQSFGPGPTALSPDGRYLYVVANDDRYRGCPAPGMCHTQLERFDLSTQTFTKSLPLKDTPGVSQLYVTSDGALWIATFAPVGNWNYPLPAFHVSGSSLSSPEPLPTASFGEPSGFVADGSGNLWISSCKGRGKTSNCKQNHAGQPFLVETPITGAHKVETAIQLASQCMAFGYFGFSVGDVAYYGGDLYVLGINDGSAPPARGTIWRVSLRTHRSRCPRVPANFNPAPYFSTMTNSAKTQVLVFGVGNNANFRWFPNHGFYILSESETGNDKIVWDNGPGVTANHVSAAPAPSASPGILYYASSGKLDLRFSGLGTYEPSANPTASPGSAWSIFPSASFSGDESDNGVAADTYGAWYTANGVCGTWKGVCLGHAIYQPAWGALPGLNLQQIRVGNSTGFGVIIDPLGVKGGVTPLGAHSGPFFAQTNPPGVCSAQLVSDLTFTVNGLSAGACQITIMEKKNGKVVTSPLVTNVTQ